MSNTAIELSIFSSRLNAICDEMGASLQRSAFSPNIKDRLDFSCAIFDPLGNLCAQAAHIPVHLGSMAYAMVDLVSSFDWEEGDVMVLNDPYRGGTHLPDVTVVAPVFDRGILVGFSANRAHHANIGASSPGSMPIASNLHEEGVVIAPTLIMQRGKWCDSVMKSLCGDRDDLKAKGDFYAQVSAAQLGATRVQTLVQSLKSGEFELLLTNLNHYAEELAVAHWRKIPDGCYRFVDHMDSDGLGQTNIPIAVKLVVQDGRVSADFSGTSPQVAGNINCPLSVAAAAVFYCFRCLLPDYAPACAGMFRPLTLRASAGTLVNANYPAAVAAGNVETSSRIVDVVFGALSQAIPERIGAASQGTMNNLAMGSAAQNGEPAWDYYETLAGGAGASGFGDGMSARHTHMTNTLNTPIESLESHCPVRVRRYQVRWHSGGAGKHRGGDGIVREYQFLAPCSATLLTERRTLAPWGILGGEPGLSGANYHNDEILEAKVCLQLDTGDCLRIETPGGGGWNSTIEKR